MTIHPERLRVRTAWESQIQSIQTVTVPESRLVMNADRFPIPSGLPERDGKGLPLLRDQYCESESTQYFNVKTEGRS